jgi:dsDNA-binding SOS-regulon protein
MADNKDYKYDVAISFAEEDRLVASNIAHALEIKGRSSYFYPECRSDDFGHNLEAKLNSVYSADAKFAVVIFSENYFKQEKIYTKIELEAIKKRMEIEADSVYMLPVKLDADFDLPGEPELNKLIYLVWNYNEKEIADTLDKLLGQQLSSNDENAVPGSIQYNYGNASMVINGININDFRRGAIISTGDGNTVNQFNVENNQITVDKLRDKRVTCANCNEPLKGDDLLGRVKCHKCGIINIVPSSDKIAIIYITLLDHKECKEYDKLRAHIQNKIRDKNYEAAYNYCLEAEKMAPGEYYTWEHFAVTQALLEINKEPAQRKSTADIMRVIKSHMDKCKAFKMEPDAYDTMLLDIANKLFTIERLRILSLFGQYNNNIGFSMWSKRHVQNMLGHLRSFEICYGLNKNPAFLKEYVAVLTREYKWIVKRAGTGEEIKVFEVPGLNPITKLKALVEEIKLSDDNYEPPDIPEERFSIIKRETLKINNIIVKSR